MHHVVISLPRVDDAHFVSRLPCLGFGLDQGGKRVGVPMPEASADDKGRAQVTFLH